MSWPMVFEFAFAPALLRFNICAFFCSLLLLYCIDSAAEYVWGVPFREMVHVTWSTYHCPRPFHCTEKEEAHGTTECSCDARTVPPAKFEFIAFLMCGLRGMGSPRRFYQLVLHSAQPERGAGFL